MRIEWLNEVFGDRKWVNNGNKIRIYLGCVKVYLIRMGLFLTNNIGLEYLIKGHHIKQI